MILSKILEGKNIRFTKKNNKKYYSIISVLEEFKVSSRARKYWYDAKKKIESSEKKLLAKIKQLKIEASDGKQRLLDCVGEKDLEAILRSLPSRKLKLFFSEQENKDTKKKIEKKTNKNKKVNNKKVTKKDIKKEVKKETQKEVKKEVAKETKKALKKVPKKKIKKKSEEIKKEAKKAVTKETKKITKNIKEEKILKKAKNSKKNVKKLVEKEVSKELKKDIKKKKCGIICKIVKIFS